MMDLTPYISKQVGDKPVYLQIYEWIKTDVETGRIEEGTKLPSIRVLANHLRISKNTVELAYQQLIAEGYAESKPRSGLIVRYHNDLLPNGARRPSKRGIPKAVPDSDDEPVKYDFKYGDPSIEGFPFAAWKRCLVEALYDADAAQALGYSHPQGDYRLRLEIADYLFQSRGVVCKPEQLFLCAGTQYAVDLIVKFLGLQGKRVIMEEPGYHGVRTVLLSHGCIVAGIPLEEDGLDTGLLDASVGEAIYVTPSHQFPMGMVLSIQKRMQLLQWATRTGGMIIEDDYDSEFRYQGQPIPALKSLDTEDRVVYLGTFSKSFMPAARMSYIVVPERLLSSFGEQMAQYSQSVSPLIQKAMQRFMSEGHFGRHVRRMRRIYQTKHKLLLTSIQKHMGASVEVIGQKSGLHLLLTVPGRSGAELIGAALDSGIKIYSPDIHWKDGRRCSEGTVMLGFGGLKTEEIESAVERLAQAWNRKGT